MQKHEDKLFSRDFLKHNLTFRIRDFANGIIRKQIAMDNQTGQLVNLFCICQTITYVFCGQLTNERDRFLYHSYFILSCLYVHANSCHCLKYKYFLCSMIAQSGSYVLLIKKPNHCPQSQRQEIFLDLMYFYFDRYSHSARLQHFAKIVLFSLKIYYVQALTA